MRAIHRADAFVGRHMASATLICVALGVLFPDTFSVMKSLTIWMFASKEQYDSNAGLWLAMIVQKGDDSPWEMNIDRDQLKLLHEGPSVRFGLSDGSFGRAHGNSCHLSRGGEYRHRCLQG